MLGNDALNSDVKETKLCFCRPASAELLFGYENNLSALTGTSDQRGSLWERVIKQSQVTYLTRRTIFLYLSASPVPEHSRVAGQQHVAGVGVAAAAVLRAGPRDGRHGDQDGRDLHRPPAPRLALGWGHLSLVHVFTSPLTCVSAGTRSGGSLFIQPDFDIEESHALDDMKRDYFRFVDIDVVLNFSKCSITEATTCVCWRT